MEFAILGAAMVIPSILGAIIRKAVFGRDFR